jgi:hypothetical protein
MSKLILAVIIVIILVVIVGVVLWKKSASGSSQAAIVDVGAAGGAGGDPFELTCAPGYISEISGMGGQVVDQISIKCADGRVYGPRGKPNEIAFGPAACETGFDGVDVLADQFIDQIAPVCNGSFVGQYGGSNGNPASLRCPPGYVVSSLYGRSGDIIDNLGVKCVPKPQQMQ